MKQIKIRINALAGTVAPNAWRILRDSSARLSTVKVIQLDLIVHKINRY